MCYKSLLNFLRGNDNIKKFFFVCCFIFLLIGFIFALIMYSKIVLEDESESLKVSHDSLLKNWREEGHQDDEDEIKIMRNDTNNNNNNWDSEIENITSHLSLSSTGEGDPNKNEKNYLFKARNIWSDSKTIAPEAIGGLSRRRRNKRSVIHLFNMVLCATGCNPLAFKGYGCFCGFLGSGYPVDGIDRCCWLHDQCYDATGCPTFLEYFVPYYWKCYRGSRPICAITHGSWGGPGSCSQRLCECDRALSQCLRKYPCPESKAVCTSAPFRLIQNIFMML